MNSEITTTESKTVKPCIKCGAADRNGRGACKPCAKEAVRAWRNADPDKSRDTNRKQYKARKERALADTKPCRKCGASERYKSGGCAPCDRERYHTGKTLEVERVRLYLQRRKEMGEG